MALNPDGIFLSNGPGDPDAVPYAKENVQKLIGKKPIFGICLGHQIMGLALGGKTYKLKFGHHGGNQPVMDLTTRKVEITAQNHGFAVDADSLKGAAEVTHLNLNDNTVEGLAHRELPIFSVQYHPESSPGPHDAELSVQALYRHDGEAPRLITSMPKRTDIQSILLIGAGPIIIGQACEFDYSGTQALKALKEEGYRVILVNSNPATIMTDPGFADRTYIEPITTDIVEKIIAKERPDAILPTLGGQTALNLAIDLAEKGILETLRRRDDRRQTGVDQKGRRPRSVQRGHAAHRPRPAAQRLRAQHAGCHAHSKALGFSGDHSRVAHAWRQRRQFRLRCRTSSKKSCRPV